MTSTQSPGGAGWRAAAGLEPLARMLSRQGILPGINTYASDRTIAGYKAQIWDAKPCPVQERNP